MRFGDRVLLPLVACLAACPLFLGFVSEARNRLLSGRTVGLFAAAEGPPAWVCGISFAILLIGAASGRRWAALSGAACLSGGLCWLAGTHAASVAVTLPASRVALGAAFWLMQAFCLLILAEVARALGPRATILAVVLVLVPLVTLLSTGQMDALSLLREYANKRDVLWPALSRHIGIVILALVPTLLIGVPLGIACQRLPALGGGVFPALGLVQTIPSIALFGLLMAPLSGLAAWFPALGRAGISGIGVAPAVIALVLYALLPITRNTASGLEDVPASVRDAARGIGMTDRQVFWRVDAVLAFPAFLAGLRITLVQSIGLAAVAALIGAGGLGAIMFDGLFAGALDLVLLGALPVIGLAIAADLLLRLAAGGRA